MKNLRAKLKSIESYFIEKELFDKLYFRDVEDKYLIDGKPPEFWIFKYVFIRRLRDEAVGARVHGYDRHQVYRKTIKILENNKSIIEEFLLKH